MRLAAPRKVGLMSKQSELVQSVVELGRSAFEVKCELVKMGARDAREVVDEARVALAQECGEASALVDEMLGMKEEG